MATETDVIGIAAEYRDCLLALERAVVETGPDTDVTPDAREIARCLLRAISTGCVIRSINDGGWETAHLLANKKHIHEVLGAPGDWGYEHPIGKALSRLYRMGLEALPLGDHKPNSPPATYGQLDIVHALNVICDQFSKSDDPLALDWDAASDLVEAVIAGERSFESIVGGFVELSGVADNSGTGD